MANTLQIKRGVWNTTGQPSSLSYGEIAWDNASEVLYIGKQTDAGGTITVTSLNNVVISDIPDATSSVKGLASFSSDNFTVTNGAVIIKDLGIATEEIKDNAITNDKIANNAVTLGTQTTGNYVATIADAGNTAITVANSGTESAAVTLDIANDGVALGTKTTGNYVATISGTTNEIEVSGSGSETAAVTIGLPNDVTIGNDLTVTGDLTVNGTTTTLNTSTLDVEDLNITVAKGAASAAAADGAGLTVDGPTIDATLLYRSTGDKWVVNKAFEASAGFVDTTFDGGTY